MAAPGGKVGRKQFGKIKRRGNPYPQGVVELFIAARVDALHQRQGVVDEVVHMAIVGNHLTGKRLQDRLIRQIPLVVRIGQQVDDTHMCSGLSEFPGNGFSDAFGTSGDHGDFVFKHIRSSSVRILVQGFHQKAHGTEAVVAGEHGGLGILHPAVVKVLRTVAQGPAQRGERVSPGTLAKALGLGPSRWQ